MDGALRISEPLLCCRCTHLTATGWCGGEGSTIDSIREGYTRDGTQDEDVALHRMPLLPSLVAQASETAVEDGSFEDVPSEREPLTPSHARPSWLSEMESQSLIRSSKKRLTHSKCHSQRALSVSYLRKKLPYEIRVAGLSLDSNIYQIEPHVIRAKGAAVVDPRDGKLGAAYVDCFSEPDDAGPAELMLSYTWAYKIGDIIDTLWDFCDRKSLTPNRAYIWMCCFCINQHRVVEMKAANETVSFEDFRKTFENNVKGIGRIVAMVHPWRQPHYIKRLWCIFELYTAFEHHLELEIAMPKREATDFCISLCQGSGLDETRNMLTDMDIRNADATVEADKVNIKRIIEEGSGYDVLNGIVSEYFLQWVTTTVQHYVDDIRFSDSVDKVGKMRACLNAGHLRYRVGDIEGAMKNFRLGRKLTNNMSATPGRTPVTPQEPDEVERELSADLLLGMAQVERERGDFQKFLSCSEQAKVILKRSGNLYTATGASLLWSIASACKDKGGDLDKAVEYYSEAKEIREQMDTMGTEGGAWILWGMADVSRKRGDYEAALGGFLEVEQHLLAFDEKVTSCSAWTKFSIANIKLQTNKLGEAYKGFVEAKKLREKMGTLFVMDGAVVLLGIAETFRRRKELRKALHFFKVVWEMAKKRDLLEYPFFSMVLGDERLVDAKKRVEEALEQEGADMERQESPPTEGIADDASQIETPPAHMRLRSVRSITSLGSSSELDVRSPSFFSRSSSSGSGSKASNSIGVVDGRISVD